MKKKLMNMNLLQQLRAWIEYWGGQRDQPPGWDRTLCHGLLTALWWTILASLIALFCGQTSKFIYVDF